MKNTFKNYSFYTDRFGQVAYSIFNYRPMEQSMVTYYNPETRIMVDMTVQQFECTQLCHLRRITIYQASQYDPQLFARLEG